jgi:hypothetical protein
MPEDNDKPADPQHRVQDGKDSDTKRRGRKWPRKVWAAISAVGVIASVLGLGTELGHWFTGLSQASDATCHMSTANVLPESPNLGISFHQNGQLAVMNYVNYDSVSQIPVIDVCLNAAPFEIEFATLGTDTNIAICTSTQFAIFRQYPFHGCLAPATGAADAQYSSGILFESSPQGPPHTEIGDTRAAPASNGDQMYFVSRLVPYSGKFHTVPISSNTGSLYLIVYKYTYIPYDYSYYPTDVSKLEHFVLRFK